MALKNKDSDACKRPFHYLYAIEFGKKRILRPESMKFVIGRSECADFVIASGDVDRKQCEIVCSGDSWMIRNWSPKGTSLVGRAVVRDKAIKLEPGEIFKVGSIYIQFKFEIESKQLPIRVLKVIALKGEKYCHLATQPENHPGDLIGNVATESMEDSVIEIPIGNSKTEETAATKDGIIDLLSSENKHILQELTEIKSALQKALIDKGEAELKAAQVDEQLKLFQKNSATEGDIGEIFETELQCSICNELIIDAVTLDCTHSFCEYCLMRWKKKSRICPLCRSIIHHECKSRMINSLTERIIGSLPEDTRQRRKELTDSRKDVKGRRSYTRGAQNKRRRLAVIELHDPIDEVLRMTVFNTDAANETIDISSDEDIP